MSEPGKMWGGRFAGELDAHFATFQKSLPVDRELVYADLAVNRAWSRALGKAGVLTEADVQSVHAAIEDVEATLREQGGVPQDHPAEDIHSFVEGELGKRCGELAKRVHTARSRNDQVATDLRIRLRELAREIQDGIGAVQEALLGKAEQHAADPMPGYTHLQRAQPITIGHWALAHLEALERDHQRIADATRRMDRCPLGSGALAGAPLPIDREDLAVQLGFCGGATRNSLDATSARDHACELLFACAMTMTQLSRLAEDTVFFASTEARFGTFGDLVSTGSSLMPQKRNPDAMELVRGNAGVVLGALTGLMATVKGLPMAYNRDLQEDKTALLPALRRTADCLRVAATAVSDFSFDVARCAAESERGFLNATDLADLLVASGVAFRDAHETVGRCVNRAVELGCELQDLPAADRSELLPELRHDLGEALAASAVVARRDVIGGTAPNRVAAEVTSWQGRLAERRQQRNQR